MSRQICCPLKSKKAVISKLCESSLALRTNCPELISPWTVLLTAVASSSFSCSLC